MTVNLNFFQNGTIFSEELNEDLYLEYSDLCLESILTKDSQIITQISACAISRQNKSDVYKYEILGEIMKYMRIIIIYLQLKFEFQA